MFFNESQKTDLFYQKREALKILLATLYEIFNYNVTKIITVIIASSTEINLCEKDSISFCFINLLNNSSMSNKITILISIEIKTKSFDLY